MAFITIFLNYKTKFYFAHTTIKSEKGDFVWEITS